MPSLKIMIAVLALCSFFSHGQGASPLELVHASQQPVEHSLDSARREDRPSRHFVCELEEGSSEMQYLIHRLYRAARFEGEDEPSEEDWQKIINNPCSIEVILDWREGVSHIVDGLADHSGAAIIDGLIDRSLAEGSLYLYIALVPYSDSRMQERYASYFVADDAFRAAFEERVAESNQPGFPVTCPDRGDLDDWPDSSDYVGLPFAESLDEVAPGGVPACFGRLVMFARAGHSEGQAMLAGLGDDAVSQALRYLIETRLEDMEVGELVRRMFDAGEPLLWEAALFALESGQLAADDEPDREELAGLVPRDPATALRYASVMADVTGDPAYWSGVTSTIIIKSDGVPRGGGLGYARLAPDLARLDDWLDSLSPSELAVFVEHLTTEKQLELPAFVDPAQLTVVTFAHVLARFYEESVEPPVEWLEYFDNNLADWMLAHLPEELVEADVWDRSHDTLLRRPGDVIDALGQVLTAMGPLQTFAYLGVLAESESPALVRLAYAIRLMMVPNHAHFLEFVDSGVTPALVADGLEEEQARVVVMTGLDSERPGPVLELVEHLDCYYFRDPERWRVQLSEPFPRRGGPIFRALRERVEHCGRQIEPDS